MSRSRSAIQGGSKSTRRRFLRRSGAVVATAAVASRTDALRADRTLGANERIGVGVIGCGGRGNNHLTYIKKLADDGVNVDVAAACDVYRPRLNAAASGYGVPGYMDHMELLQDKNVDVVCIASPDHIHGQQVIDAARAGRDAYCEKPLTHWRQFDLTKRMAREVKQHKRIVQVGTQYLSDGAWHQAARLIRDGAIGQPVHAECGYFRIGDWGERGMKIDDPKAQAGPDLRWDAFLGDAPKREFDVSRFFRWRMYEDYSGGPVTDLFPHFLTPMVSMLGVSMPSEVVAVGGKFRYQEREVPDTFNLLINYPEKITVAVLGTQGNDYQGTGTRDGARVPIIRGWEAALTVQGNRIVIKPVEKSKVRPQRITIEYGLDQLAYWRNFLDACRTRKQPWGHLELAYHAQTALQMGMLAFRNNRTVTFNAESEEIIL